MTIATPQIGPARYSLVAIALHWLIALLIAFNFIAAFSWDYFAKPQQYQIIGVHKAVGITVLLLTVLRLVWRLIHRPPPLDAALRRWERLAAQAVHYGLYALMLAVPLAGWAMHSADSGGKPVPVLGLFSYPGLPMAQNKALGENVYGAAHSLLAWAMLGLLALHVAGALKHQFIDRLRELPRMWPWG